jgi:hypothetical protein
MRTYKVLIVISFVLVALGCAHTPKQSYVVAHDLIMDKNGGVLLIADVCIQRDVIGDDDYFSIAESKEGAKELLSSTRKYLQEKQVPILAELIPFVCGSISYGNGSAAFKVAEHIGGAITEARPPFAVDLGIKDDVQLVEALAKVSSDAFRRSTTLRINEMARRTRKVPAQTPPVTLNPEEIKDAFNLIVEKMNVSSIVYLGVNGTSISRGKAFAQGLLKATVGVMTGVATGLATGGLAVVMYFPGHSVDGRYMSCGMINLDLGDFSWSGWAYGPGDPIKPGAVGEPRILEKMLYGLVHKPVPPSER